MGIAKKITDAMERASWIRKMFEEGSRLKKERGEDRVFDFSLGNPCLEPPDAYCNALREEIEGGRVGRYAYMPNAGYTETRESVARHIGAKQGVPLEARHLLMTCGAAGGLNVVFKTLLDPGDEILITAPFFPEYLFYVDNHGGRPVIVETEKDFALDLDRIEAALTPRTRALLVNSPNNPTGRMYGRETLDQLGALLAEASRKAGRALYLISDEPYAEIVFDGKVPPALLQCYENTILVNSYSKTLSIPGERLGYIAVHPQAESLAALLDGMTFSNRVLGFVNAPATPQRVIGRLAGTSVDATVYEKKRNLICDGLREAGYRFVRPDGAFYVFPESPVPDEVPFVQALLQEGILVVPGRGFGRPGHFRIAFCVGNRTIENALPRFAEVLKRYGE